MHILSSSFKGNVPVQFLAAFSFLSAVLVPFLALFHFRAFLQPHLQQRAWQMWMIYVGMGIRMGWWYAPSWYGCGCGEGRTANLQHLTRIFWWFFKQLVVGLEMPLPTCIMHMDDSVFFLSSSSSSSSVGFGLARWHANNGCRGARIQDELETVFKKVSN